MDKLLFNLKINEYEKLFFAFALALISINADAVSFMTTCGKTGTTVNPDFFETPAEFLEYMRAINDALCGEKGDPIYW